MKVVRVRQNFPRPRVDDIAGTVRRELERLQLGSKIKPGARVCLTAGSRGVANIPTILASAVKYLRELGAEPYLVASMGSHGGGTIEGQKGVLDHLGITEEVVGAPIRVTDQVAAIGEASTGQTVYCDAYAAEADAIVVINRVKMHTSFRGELESGLFKMMVVGLGKRPGATSFHSLGQKEMATSLVAMGRHFVETMPVVGGLAILENAYDETAGIYGLLPDEIEERERELQARSKEMLPRLPIDELDLLVVDEIGKNISGTGMDSNVIGRLRMDGELDFYPPMIKRIVVLGLSEATGTNGYGLGLADFTTERIVRVLDRHAMNVNALTAGFLTKAFIPITLKDDREAIDVAVNSLGGKIERVGRIRNTLELGEMELSPGLVSELRPGTDCEVISEPYEWQFDSDGRLPPMKFMAEE